MNEEKEKQDNDWIRKTNGLKELLTPPEDFAKALKLTSSKMTKGSKGYMFYAVITAYCLLSTGKK